MGGKNKLDILFEDDDLIIVNKPAHTLSIPDRFSPEKPNLLSLLKQRFEEVFVVHRLDKETSGVMCFAKNEAAHKHLSQQFENRSVQKFYLTIVEGHPEPSKGVIEKPIAKHPHKGGQMTIHRSGKMAVSAYEVIQKFKHFSLVKVNIKTGRTHQVRIHMKALGHPLVVDVIYGKRAAFYLSEIKQRRYRLGKDQEERPLLSRSALHAHQLTIQHPTTLETMTFEANMPKDMSAVLKQLEKWSSIL